MTKNMILFGCSITGVLLLGNAALSESPTNGTKHGDIAILSQKLRTEDPTERNLAYQEMIEVRRAFADRIVGIIATQANTTNFAYHGPVHLAILAAGEYRLEEAIVALVTIIDRPLDESSLPVGDRVMTSMLYPAAEALVHIGGRDMLPALLERLKNARDESTARICGWVLQEYLGHKTALNVLRQEVGIAESPMALENVQRLLDGMETRAVSLPYPGRK